MKTELFWSACSHFNPAANTELSLNFLPWAGCSVLQNTLLPCGSLHLLHPADAHGVRAASVGKEHPTLTRQHQALVKSTLEGLKLTTLWTCEVAEQLFWLGPSLAVSWESVRNQVGHLHITVATAHHGTPGGEKREDVWVSALIHSRTRMTFHQSYTGQSEEATMICLLCCAQWPQETSDPLSLICSQHQSRTIKKGWIKEGTAGPKAASRLVYSCKARLNPLAALWGRSSYRHFFLWLCCLAISASMACSS